MGYLSVSSSTILNATKMVISLWFRVPQSSIDACIAAPATGLASGVASGRIIPLVTFGRRGPEAVYNPVFRQFGTITVAVDIGGGVDDPGLPVEVPFGVFVPTQTETLPGDPSYIGLFCAPDGVTVAASFQTNVRAAFNNQFLVPTGATLVGSLEQPSGYADYSYADAGLPETYPIQLRTVAASAFADRWHHLVVSCDLTNSISTTGTTDPTIAAGVSGYNLLWAALDDINYTGDDAFPFWPEAPLDVNASLTSKTLAAAASTPRDQSLSLDTVPVFVPNKLLLFPGDTKFADAKNKLTSLDIGTITVTASIPSTPIPINGGSIGFPAEAAFVDNIFKVDLAEFQMFTGVSMDTGVEANRRAFIAPNRDGKLIPVNPFAVNPPADPTAGLDPHTLIAPGKPHKLLGKPADIVLTSSSLNWIGGINTGKSKDKLKATGTIKAFLPNPKVGS